MKKALVVAYSGKEVMQKLEQIHSEISELTVQVKVTNGNVKSNKKLIYTCFTAIGIIAGWFVLHLISSIA